MKNPPEVAPSDRRCRVNRQRLLLFEHDLFGKPMPSPLSQCGARLFRDQALGLHRRLHGLCRKRGRGCLPMPTARTDRRPRGWAVHTCEKIALQWIGQEDALRKTPRKTPCRKSTVTE